MASDVSVSIGSGNDLSPLRQQAININNASLLAIGYLKYILLIRKCTSICCLQNWRHFVQPPYVKQVKIHKMAGAIMTNQRNYGYKEYVIYICTSACLWSCLHADYIARVLTLLINKLTPCGLVTPYGDINVVNIGSGSGLLPSISKPSAEPMLASHQWDFVAFTWEQFHNKCRSYDSP